jgi:2-hydroxychromene-2-carboxylate isomerase
MTLTYDLYWSFRSPYSYLITHKLAALDRDYDVRGNIRPVYPLAVRTPEFFDGRDPLWYSYLQADIRREAEFLGLPIRWPRPDPVQMDMATRTYPKEQPRIHRLTRMGVAAAERGRGLEFLDEASRVIWSGAVDNWHEGDHEAERLNAVIEESQVAQRAAGHYGVPMIAFNNEAFFGQDRFDQFKWRLEQQGLARR